MPTRPLPTQRLTQKLGSFFFHRTKSLGSSFRPHSGFFALRLLLNGLAWALQNVSLEAILFHTRDEKLIPQKQISGLSEEILRFPEYLRVEPTLHAKGPRTKHKRKEEGYGENQGNVWPMQT